jgi:DNA-binding transcriptional LysR family regulator
MPEKIAREVQIGRRLKIHHIQVFCAVVRCGSMARAAQQVGVTQPTVSEVVADLEHAPGVRLLDRLPHGVEPTLYGDALLKRSVAVLDELQQTVRDIEFLADPTSGELWIGCAEGMAMILSPAMERFSRQYPYVVLHVDHVSAGSLELPGLRNRNYDLVLGQVVMPHPEDRLLEDLNLDILCEGQLVIAVGRNSRWARRRNVDLTELIDEPWILSMPDSWNYRLVSEAFSARGLNLPKIKLMIYSMQVRTCMSASGEYITTFPSAVVDLSPGGFPLKIIPVELPKRPWPLAIVTLKNRTLSPLVERFIQCARDDVKSRNKAMQPA